MSIRRSRRLAGLDPSITQTYTKIVVMEDAPNPSSQVAAPNIMRIISQYLFFLFWTTFLLRGVLLR